ncbi:MAG: type II toxin-antitoxin system Phd/YefM family antitoxin [Verrucomicrobia bacterium]|nr:type II toxin-antitoxin system Phd/YefM family antitoxin [Verrucomicrobiota bacterium]
MTTITVQELQAHTSDIVRRIGNNSQPLAITDGGEVLAIIASPKFYPSLRRRRTLLPEYAELLAAAPVGNVTADLDMVRGDR